MRTWSCMNEMLNKIIKNKDEKTQAKNIQLVDFRCIRFSQLKIKSYFKIHQKINGYYLPFIQNIVNLLRLKFYPAEK